MGTCVHFSRSLPSNSWWQTMVGCQVLSRPSAAEGGGRRPAFTGPATQPYSATEVDGWNSSAGCLKTGPQYIAVEAASGTCIGILRSRSAHPNSLIVQLIKDVVRQWVLEFCARSQTAPIGVGVP